MREILTNGSEEPLFERVQKISDMTPMERDLADYFTDAYPELAFKNLVDICEATQSSTATVTRFVRKLGYQNFRDFSKQLRKEISSNFDSPLQRNSEIDDDPQTPDSPAPTITTSTCSAMPPAWHRRCGAAPG